MLVDGGVGGLVRALARVCEINPHLYLTWYYQP